MVYYLVELEDGIHEYYIRQFLLASWTKNMITAWIHGSSVQWSQWLYTNELHLTTQAAQVYLGSEFQRWCMWLKNGCRHFAVSDCTCWF